MNITSLNVEYGFQVVDVKSLTVPVLTVTKGNAGSVRLVEMRLARIGLGSNLGSGWVAQTSLRG